MSKDGQNQDDHLSHSMALPLVIVNLYKNSGCAALSSLIASLSMELLERNNNNCYAKLTVSLKIQTFLSDLGQ